MLYQVVRYPMSAAPNSYALYMKGIMQWGGGGGGGSLGLTLYMPGLMEKALKQNAPNVLRGSSCTTHTKKSIDFNYNL